MLCSEALRGFVGVDLAVTNVDDAMRVLCDVGLVSSEALVMLTPKHWTSSKRPVSTCDADLAQCGDAVGSNSLA